MFNPKRKVMKIHPKYLKNVLNGTKKAEVRSWLDVGMINSYVPLENTETKKVEAIIKISDIFDLRHDFTEEEREHIFMELKIDPEFRENYQCNYLYTISEVHRIN